MKVVMVFVLLCMAIYLNAAEVNRPSICLNMIVKNEKDVICRCLESTKSLIDYWVIVDTGSSDGTQGIIKEYLKDIPGELHERPWVNFAHNRNEALLLAKNKADYLLLIDADDKFRVSSDFVMPHLNKDGYYIGIRYGGMNYDRLQLIKTTADWKWGGVVHEALIPPSMNLDVLKGVEMIIVGGGDRSNDPKKFDKDAQVLEAALQEDPSNARNMFYLAQSYRDAQKPKLSIEHYEKRVAMGGWDQEVFWSLYEIGVLNEELQASEEVVCRSYTKAFNYRPTRAEPLYRLCHYYRIKENYLMGYLVGQFALNIKMPSDSLFVEAWVYEYALLLEHSICSYWIGRYDEAKELSLKLLSKPDLPTHIRECVEKNMVFILDHLDPSESARLMKVGA